MAEKQVRTRRDERAWRALVERQKRSGLGREAFCRREGVSLASFDRWRARLASPAAAPRARFVELAAGVDRSERWAVELELPSGLKLRLRG